MKLRSLLTVALLWSSPVFAQTVPVQLVYFTVPTNTAHPVNVSTAVQTVCTQWLIPEFQSYSYGHLAITCTAFGYFDLTIANGDVTGMKNAITALIGPIPAGAKRFYIAPTGWPGNAEAIIGGNEAVMPGGGPFDHELGHMLGWGHAHSQSWVNGTASGTAEYGDRDLMGSGGNLNAFYRDYAHWFDATRQIVSVTTPQTVVLDELWSASPGLKTFKLPMTESITTCTPPSPFGPGGCNTTTQNRIYYVEFHPPFQGGPGSVQIHLGLGNSSTIEDVDKATSVDKWSLDPGGSYCFPNATCLTNLGYGSDAVGPTAAIRVNIANTSPAPINHTR